MLSFIMAKNVYILLKQISGVTINDLKHEPVELPELLTETEIFFIINQLVCILDTPVNHHENRPSVVNIYTTLQ